MKVAAVLLFALGLAEAVIAPRGSPKNKRHMRQKRQFTGPAPITNVTTITTPTGARISYKLPGEQGVCETTPGVKSYAGYVELAPDMHSFFWFFESRNNPSTDPITLWLNGGPGSDSEIGLFQELGPCSINENIESVINPYSWTNVSNMIFLSQPYGVGFSYQDEGFGSYNNISGAYQNTTYAPADGYYPLVNAEDYSTTEISAIAAWEVLQGLYSGLAQLAPNVTSLEFNLWTESYGGHYGPTFFKTFSDYNDKVGAGEIEGKHLKFNSLGLINAIISEKIQAPYYPEFATKNTYGIVAYNESIYNYTQIALHMPNGCLDYVEYCELADRSTLAGKAICTEASNLCRDNVEGMYYNFGERGVYDVRHSYDDPTPPPYFEEYLGLPEVQNAIGVNFNYSTSNTDIYYAFQQTGDFVYPTFLDDLEEILDSGVSVGLFYGDADYICNWFGGEAVSKEVKYKHSKEFNAAGYVPFIAEYLNGTTAQFGETRQYGNFSFSVIYEAGHEIPYYQPEAAFAFFNRSLHHLNIADGSKVVTANYSTNGTADSTATHSFVPLPSTTSSSSATVTAETTGAPEIDFKLKGPERHPVKPKFPEIHIVRP